MVQPYIQTQDLVYGKLHKASGVNCVRFYNGSTVVTTSTNGILHYFINDKLYEKVSETRFLAQFKTEELPYIKYLLKELTKSEVRPHKMELWGSIFMQAQLIPDGWHQYIQQWANTREVDEETLYDIINSGNSFIENEILEAYGSLEYHDNGDMGGFYPVLASAFILKGTGSSSDPICITFNANELSKKASKNLPPLLVLPLSEWVDCVNYFSLYTKGDYINNLNTTS